MIKVLNEGYAAGTVDGGEWLTVIGSAYRSDLVFATRAEAEARAADLRSKWRNPAEVVVRRVQRVFHPSVTLAGVGFRIVPESSPVQ